jgi:Mg2+ and Co2+ transporter CorA
MKKNTKEIDYTLLLKEDIEDKSMQENFARFERNREFAKTSYNALVPSINSMISQIVNLKELIVSLAVQGLPTEEAIKRLTKLDEDFTKLSEKADEYKSEMNKQDTLIKNYKDWTERKLFMHWKYLTLLKVTEEPWLTWKKQYEGIII